ncbi:MAG: RNA polymerase sigma factor [Candidatus Omnitrophota bacterium]|nr:RNA polymerase sigma factor [Candidatus Omnitrophota bacterium]
MDDLEFVRRCVKGDKRVWNEFVERYSSLIYNYIHSVLKIKGRAFSQENINDLFQDIFLSLAKHNFKKLGSFQARNGSSLASWLRQVTVNFTIDYLRKLKPLVSIDQETDDGSSLAEILSSNSPSVTDVLSQEERLMHLKDCIDKLALDDKYFLELHIYRGLAIEELKTYLKVSRAAVDMRKSRIVERLRECFKGKGFMLTR